MQLNNLNNIPNASLCLVDCAITGKLVARVFRQDNPDYPYYISAAKFGIRADEIKKILPESVV